MLFRIGPVEIYSYGAMLALAFLAAMVVATAEARRKGLRAEAMPDFFLAIIILAVVFSRVVYIAFNLTVFTEAPWRVFNLREGGLAIHGGILGGVLAGWWFARRERIPFLVLADTAAPPLALGTAIGRIGCFLNGCCYGVLTTGWWGTLTRYAPGLRHPTQLYESGLSLLLLGLLWHARTRTGRPGRLFFLYLGGYGLVRFAVETVREVEGYFGPVTYAQAFSLVLLAVAAGFWLLARDGHRQ